MPLKYWWKACSISTFLINGLPTKVVKNKSPLQKLFEKKIDFSLLKYLGCKCFPFLHPYNTWKFLYHSDCYIFLGYNYAHKGYNCKSLPLGKFFINPNIIFNDNCFLIIVITMAFIMPLLNIYHHCLFLCFQTNLVCHHKGSPIVDLSIASSPVQVGSKTKSSLLSNVNPPTLEPLSVRQQHFFNIWKLWSPKSSVLC